MKFFTIIMLLNLIGSLPLYANKHASQPPQPVANPSALALGVELRNAATRGDNDKIRSLLAKHIDVNSSNKFGITPLMRAAEEGNTATTALLLSEGADVNARSKSGLTSLLFATENGHADITAMLIEMRANIHDRTKKGWNALMIAARYDYPVIVAQLLEAGADSRASDNKGDTALMYAVDKGRLDIVKNLQRYDKHLDLYLPNKNGITPLMKAVEKENQEMVSLLLSIDNKGINQQDQLGETALIIATETGQKAIANILLQHHADPLVKNEEGLTAIDIAKYTQQPDMLMLLNNSRVLTAPLKPKAKPMK